MPIWGGYGWGSAGDKHNCCCKVKKLTFLVLVSIPLKKWRCGANFLFIYFLTRSNCDILMSANKHLMVYEKYKFHLHIVCDM